MESKIQKKIITELEKRGYFCVKLIKTNKNGVPDLLVCKDNDYFFVEVKTEKGKLSELQKCRIKEMKLKGIEVKVWTGYETEL